MGTARCGRRWRRGRARRPRAFPHRRLRPGPSTGAGGDGAAQVPRAPRPVARLPGWSVTARYPPGRYLPGRYPPGRPRRACPPLALRRCGWPPGLGPPPWRGPCRHSPRACHGTGRPAAGRSAADPAGRCCLAGLLPGCRQGFLLRSRPQSACRRPPAAPQARECSAGQALAAWPAWPALRAQRASTQQALRTRQAQRLT
jgi:hypothetical protein